MIEKILNLLELIGKKVIHTHVKIKTIIEPEMVLRAMQPKTTISINIRATEGGGCSATLITNKDGSDYLEEYRLSPGDSITIDHNYSLEMSSDISS